MFPGAFVAAHHAFQRILLFIRWATVTTASTTATYHSIRTATATATTVPTMRAVCTGQWRYLLLQIYGQRTESFRSAVLMHVRIAPHTGRRRMCHQCHISAGETQLQRPVVCIRASWRKEAGCSGRRRAWYATAIHTERIVGDNSAAVDGSAWTRETDHVQRL